jgi:hypothetical protein
MVTRLVLILAMADRGFPENGQLAKVICPALQSRTGHWQELPRLIEFCQHQDQRA